MSRTVERTDRLLGRAARWLRRLRHTLDPARRAEVEKLAGTLQFVAGHLSGHLYDLRELNNVTAFQVTNEEGERFVVPAETFPEAYERWAAWWNPKGDPADAPATMAIERIGRLVVPFAVEEETTTAPAREAREAAVAALAQAGNNGVLTYRQWVLLQQALIGYKSEDFYLRQWDEEVDGSPPSCEEIEAIAVIVGDMPHEKKGP
jgi:hypothetical protein